MIPRVLIPSRLEPGLSPATIRKYLRCLVYQRQPHAKNEARLRGMNTNASILLGKIFNITVESGKMSVYTDKEGGFCGMCESQKFVNIPLNGTATIDGGKGQIQVEVCVLVSFYRHLF